MNIDYDLKNEELLKFALENGILDMPHVKEQIEMVKRKELLEKHPYKIWQGKDNKFYTYLPDKEKGRILKKRLTQTDIESEVIEYWKSELEDPMLSEVFSEWNDRRLELGKISKPTWQRNQQIFNRHFSSLGNMKIKSLTESDICDFLEEQISEFNLTSKAFSGLKSITKGFLKRAKKRKLIDLNINDIFSDMDLTDSSFKKIIKEDNQEVFNDEELSKVFDYLMSNLDIKNMGILLMFISGVRVGELVTLKHSDFDGNTFKVRRTETRIPKEMQGYNYEVKEFPKSNAGVRTVVIPDSYEWLLNKLKLSNPFGEYIFCNENGERLTTNCIRNRMYRICRKLNIVAKSPHKVRKTYGTILLDNNIDKKFITCQMGHTSIITTENHYHRNRKSIQQKTEIISSVPELTMKNSKVINR